MRKMAIRILVLGWAGLASSYGVSVIPQPVSLKEQPGAFALNAQTGIRFRAGSAEAQAAAEYLALALRPATGFPLPVGPLAADRDATNVLVLIDRYAGLPAEGYRLEVTPASVRIAATSGAGLLYGIQTLRQLLPPAVMGSSPAPAGTAWTAPAVEIEDAPRFPWRGLLLDVCRHFYTVDEVKQLIDLMAFYKLNTFHWHLTDDQGWRIEIKKYPRLTTVGAVRAESPQKGDRTKPDGTPYGPFFYTQDQIRDVVAYAAARHVTIVPEIEMPGHNLAALSAYPELGCTGGPYHPRTTWGVEPDVLCAGNDKVFPFLEDVLTEVLALFPGPFIHVGGDEAPKDRWKACPKCQARRKAEGLKDEHELQSWFIRHFDRWLAAKGRRLIGWDEILEGGLAPGAALMSWRGVQYGITAAQSGHDVVMAPNAFLYLDRYQSQNKEDEPYAIGGFIPLERVYGYDPVAPELTAAQARHVLGAQGTLWTEYIDSFDQLQYMAMPRLAAVAERLWSPASSCDWNSFFARLHAQTAHLDAAGIHYRPLDKPTAGPGEPAVQKERKKKGDRKTNRKREGGEKRKP